MSGYEQFTTEDGDDLTILPFDKSISTHNELLLIDSLFTKKKAVFDRILENSPDLVLLFVLFGLFSIPQTNELVHRLVPPTRTSFYILTAVKAAIFALVYFILVNIYLARRT